MCRSLSTFTDRRCRCELALSVHSSKPRGADPGPLSSPGPAALWLQVAAQLPSSLNLRPLASGSFPQDVPLFASHQNGFFFFFFPSLGRALLQDQPSPSAAMVLTSKFGQGDRGRSAGALSWRRSWRDPQGTALDREDTKATRGRALSKVTRLAERTRFVRRLGSSF